MWLLEPNFESFITQKFHEIRFFHNLTGNFFIPNFAIFWKQIVARAQSKRFSTAFNKWQFRYLWLKNYMITLSSPRLTWRRLFIIVIWNFRNDRFLINFKTILTNLSHKSSKWIWNCLVIIFIKRSFRYLL